VIRTKGVHSFRGERNRLPCNDIKGRRDVLLLDEPTNDLDINTLRALEEGLRALQVVR
jgi:ATPase subunit of ABC transporter with duplicated ATPase domains